MKCNGSGNVRRLQLPGDTAATAATRRPRRLCVAAVAAATPGRPAVSRSASGPASTDSTHAPLMQRSLQLVVGAAAAAALLLQPMAADAAEYSMGGNQLFNADAYGGRWYEVASLKKGFAGEGQQDCHCTQVRCYGAHLGTLGLHSCMPVHAPHQLSGPPPCSLNCRASTCPSLWMALQNCRSTPFACMEAPVDG